MAATRAPKQWCLSKIENVNSFENWKQNLIYTLSLDPNFAQFLIDGVQWGKKTRNSPLRGFRDDAADMPEERRRTAQQKVNMLELMLGQIANYCPVISRNTIVKNSTSIENIYGKLFVYILDSNPREPILLTSMPLNWNQMRDQRTCIRGLWYSLMITY